MRQGALIYSLPCSAITEVFSEANYGGCKQILARGGYVISEMEMAISSVKAAPHCVVIFYEFRDGSGEMAEVREDTAELSLSFIPEWISVKTYAKAQRGEEERYLYEGEYELSELAEYDKIIIPRGFYLAFIGHKEDVNKICLFEHETCIVGEFAEQYEKAVLFSLGQDDVRLDYKSGEELSDDDLMAIAGGKGEKKCNIYRDKCEIFCGREYSPPRGG